MDFNALDPQTRSVALVGTFLQHWATMESGMNTAIQKALNLNDTQAIIVTTNLALRDKVHILRTAVNVSRLPEVNKAKFDKTLLSIAKASSTRNMVAHDLFGPSKNPRCAVDFYAFRAKGKLNTPIEKWSVAKFQAAFERMHKCGLVMDELQSAFGNDLLLEALLKAKGRFGLFGGSSPDSSRDLPPGGILDFYLNPANLKKDDETPR